MSESQLGILVTYEVTIGKWVQYNDALIVNMEKRLRQCFWNTDITQYCKQKIR